MARYYFNYLPSDYAKELIANDLDHARLIAINELKRGMLRGTEEVYIQRGNTILGWLKVHRDSPGSTQAMYFEWNTNGNRYPVDSKTGKLSKSAISEHRAVKELSKRFDPDSRFRNVERYSISYRVNGSKDSTRTGIIGNVVDARRVALDIIRKGYARKVTVRSKDCSGEVKYTDRPPNANKMVWGFFINEVWVEYLLKSDGTLGRRL